MVGPPQQNSLQELESLAGRLRRLLEPWAQAPDPAGEGLEVSAAELAALVERSDQHRLELAGQVKKAREALHEANRLAAGAPDIPAKALQRAREGAALNLRSLLERLAATRQELELLRQTAELYPELLAGIERHLSESLPASSPPARPALDEAWQSHREARRAQARCARLAGLARRIRAGRQRLEQRAHKLGGRAQEINQEIEAQGKRLDELQQAELAGESGQGVDQELAGLQQELARQAGPAVALGSSLEQLELALERQRKRLVKVGRAWHETRDQWSEHARRRGQAATQALAQAQQRLQNAGALSRAAGELRELLWPLRPAELAGELDTLAARAHALEQAAQQEVAQAQRLQSDGRTPAPMPGEDGDPPPTAAAPLPRVDLAGLTGVSQRAEALAQARRARALARQQAELLRWQKRAAAWAAQLKRARAESRRLHKLAERLKARKQAARQQGRDRARALSQEAQELRDKVDQLTRQLGSLAAMTALTKPPAKAVALRVAPPVEPEQVEGALDRLGRARRRLAFRGVKPAVAAWLLSLALASGMILGLPGMSAKATMAEYTPKVSATRLAGSALAPPPEARLEVRLVPLKAKIMPLELLDDPAFIRLSAQAGLSPYALYYSARKAYPGAPALEIKRLESLAAKARDLAARHPDIFADVAHGGLPPSFGQLVGAGAADAAAMNRFSGRLYRDYRRLGYSRQRALATVAASQRAAAGLVKDKRLPGRFWGRVRPIQTAENMKLGRFLDRLSPYIADRCRRFLAIMGRRPPKDLEGYARDLAFDMYCAAKKFAVPVSYLLTIAHQETFYANVLGDENLSASPFQIWRPTLPRILRSMRSEGFSPPPGNIRLQHHLTIATEMAAFHLRELMREAVVPRSKRYPAYVNMDKVMLRYNGSKLYAGRVAVRRAELDRFLARAGS